ncbi:ferrochelatase [Rarobacter incanus]|uniref:Coproporphyrin III ferrochelatase n=1 Tax=Rarobacter incanus TaxID=153494 RepID=A0A542SQT6_9MICO|nr:ferrochelatase [Rarobacter incanus]TQK76557.1 ferrochelatase [Rarobacter incanus]
MSHPALPAVVLVNLGTPAAPTAKAVRPYLREFLSDRRVVETHPALWRPILESIILTFRPRASAAKYATIWGEEGSPLLVHTQSQTRAVAHALREIAVVRYAMRYGQPSVRAVMDELYAAGHRRVLVVPLYPQYAASSAGTVLDEAYRWGLRSRDQVELRTVRSFPIDPGYVEAVAGALQESWETNGRPDVEHGDKIVLSYHGIPQAMADAGDPYRSECDATTAAVARNLGLPAGSILTTFQSTFGPAAWLKPATIDTVARLGGEGVRRVDVACPGFVSDCLETLEEIDELNREAYLEAGGGEFHYVPWGNGRRCWTDALANIVAEYLAGWVPANVRESSQTDHRGVGLTSLGSANQA